MKTIVPYLFHGPIKPSEIANLIEKYSGNRDAGAYSFFLGQVRADRVGGKRVREIVYTAYEDMVAGEAGRIKEELFDIYDDLIHLEIRHSVGSVKTGEISLLVFAVSRHREQAFKACNETVEKVKQKFPVWKKEVYEDETHEWKES
ncbi:MAG: molybdenum cofactor biosynthesis protein MoaE [Bacteroidales bacterium]|nr:MAG: molybdenum cofactor biosynthesis protein MoaE [Bacteroidales bacterium]